MGALLGLLLYLQAPGLATEMMEEAANSYVAGLSTSSFTTLWDPLVQLLSPEEGVAPTLLEAWRAALVEEMRSSSLEEARGTLLKRLEKAAEEWSLAWDQSSDQLFSAEEQEWWRAGTEFVRQSQQLLQQFTPADVSPRGYLRIASAPKSTAATPREATDPYHTLALGEEEQRIIAHILMTLSEKNPLALAFERKSLEKNGRRIEHVHPLRFLGYVCNDSRLLNALREVRKSSFKWQGFASGIGRRLGQEADRDNLIRHLPGFAATLRLNHQKLASFVEKRDWEGLVQCLIDSL